MPESNTRLHLLRDIDNYLCSTYLSFPICKITVVITSIGLMRELGKFIFVKHLQQFLALNNMALSTSYFPIIIIIIIVLLLLLLILIL